MKAARPAVILAVFDGLDAVGPVVRRGAEVAALHDARLLVVKHAPPRIPALGPLAHADLTALAAFGDLHARSSDAVEESGFADAVEALLPHAVRWSFAQIASGTGRVVRDLGSDSTLRGVVIPDPRDGGGRRRHALAKEVRAAARRHGARLFVTPTSRTSAAWGEGATHFSDSH